MANHIAEKTGLPFVTADNKFAQLAAHDAVVAASGALNTLAASLMKIANDVRWLGSGPRCGLGVYHCLPMSPGPVLCQESQSNSSRSHDNGLLPSDGNHTAITIGGSQGNFELNVYKPMMIYNLLHSCRILSDTCHAFADKCVVGLKANEKAIQSHWKIRLCLSPH